MLLISTIILAAAISTSSNNDFFNVPSWMPTSVRSDQTPGSANFVAHTVLTTSDAAALQAIWDGYCQRVYEMNRCVSNVWDVHVFGGRHPLDFRFPANLNGGNRVTPQGRGVIGLDNMREFAAHCQFDDFHVTRPSWPCDGWVLSSSALGIDGGLPEFEWTTPSWELFVTNYVTPLTALNTDCFHTNRTVSPILDWWKAICHEDSDVFSLRNPDGITFNYDEMARRLFESNSTTEVKWVPNGVFNVTEELDGVQRWCGSAARLLAPMDRVYAANRVPGANTYDHCSYAVDRTMNYVSPSELNITSQGITFSLAEPLIIEKRDWSVGQMSATTNKIDGLYYGGDCAARILVSAVNQRLSYHCVSHTFQTERHYKSTAIQALEYVAPAASRGTFVIREGIHPETLRSTLYFQFNDGEEIAATYNDFTPPTTILVTIDGGVNNSYTCSMTSGNVKNFVEAIRPYGDGGGSYCVMMAYKVYPNEDSEYQNFWYKATQGPHSGYDLTNSVNNSVADMLANMGRTMSNYGRYTNPISYVPIPDYEARTKGRVTGGRFGATENGRYEMLYSKSDSSSTDYEIIDDRVLYIYAGTTNELKWSEMGDSIFVTRWFAVPTYEIIEDPSPAHTNKASLIGVGDAYLIQTKTFDFGAISIED